MRNKKKVPEKKSCVVMAIFLSFCILFLTFFEHFVDHNII